jgi:hypothetical protein
MKNFKTKVFFLLIIIPVFLISCAKDDFTVSKANIRVLNKVETLKLKIVDDYIFDLVYNPDRFLSEDELDTKRQSERDDPSEFGNGYSLSSNEKLRLLMASINRTNDKNGFKDLKRTKQENEDLIKFKAILDKEDIKFAKKLKEQEQRLIAERKVLSENDKLKCIDSKLKIINNSKEIIENSYLTVLIKFEFENKNYFYIKPYNLMIANRKWESEQNIDFSFTEIINLSKNYNDVLSVHKPKNVEISYFITTKNSVGYSNLKKGNKELIKTGYFTQLEIDYGKFTSTKLSENQMLGLGSEILKKDITDIWNKEKN